MNDFHSRFISDAVVDLLSSVKHSFNKGKLIYLKYSKVNGQDVDV